MLICIDVSVPTEPACANDCSASFRSSDIPPGRVAWNVSVISVCHLLIRTCSNARVHSRNPAEGRLQEPPVTVPAACNRFHIRRLSDIFNSPKSVSGERVNGESGTADARAFDRRVFRRVELGRAIEDVPAVAQTDPVAPIPVQQFRLRRIPPD